MFRKKGNYKGFNEKHKEKLRKQSKSWGQKKFRPKPFERSAPEPVPEVSKPWQHVRNDILEDEKELRSAQRFNMDSQQAKEILKQREQSHRRNVIEEKRNEQTKWESFDDHDTDNAAPSLSSSKPKASKAAHKDEQHPMPVSRICTKNQKQLNPWERNFIRQKLTKIANLKNNTTNVSAIIHDLKRSNYLKKPTPFKKFQDKKSQE